MRKMPCLFQRDFTDARRPVLRAERLRRVEDGSVLLASFVAHTRHGTAYTRGHLVEMPEVFLLTGLLEQAAADLRVAVAAFERDVPPLDVLTALSPVDSAVPVTEEDALRALLLLSYDRMQIMNLDELRPRITPNEEKLVPTVDEMIEDVLAKRVDAVKVMDAIASWGASPRAPSSASSSES